MDRDWTSAMPLPQTFKHVHDRPRRVETCLSIDRHDLKPGAQVNRPETGVATGRCDFQEIAGIRDGFAGKSEGTTLRGQAQLPDLPKNAPKVRVGCETHGSIRAQEGEPRFNTLGALAPTDSIAERRARRFVSPRDRNPLAGGNNAALAYNADRRLTLPSPEATGPSASATPAGGRRRPNCQEADVRSDDRSQRSSQRLINVIGRQRGKPHIAA